MNLRKLLKQKEINFLSMKKRKRPNNLVPKIKRKFYQGFMIIAGFIVYKGIYDEKNFKERFIKPTYVLTF